jgi:hypothetical protein
LKITLGVYGRIKSKFVNKLRYSEIAEYICGNLDKEVSYKKCRAIKKHLQTCPKCYAQLDLLRKTVSLIIKKK